MKAQGNSKERGDRDAGLGGITLTLLLLVQSKTVCVRTVRPSNNAKG
jgi:hypothetical protein